MSDSRPGIAPAFQVRPEPETVDGGMAFALPEQGRKTVAKLFARRHESPLMREIARGAIRDARLWLRIFGGRT